MIKFVTVETSSLGDRSYLVHDGEVAVVVDPQRDIDRVLELAAEHGVRIAVVLETHVHNDYVSGGLELARTTGAAYVLPAGNDGRVRPHRRHRRRGDRGRPMRVRVLHTPGHTHHHVSYVLADASGAVLGVFTGGSMLYGATGRTDLVSPHDTVELTHAQFRSVRRLVAELPADTAVLPTHGFGSFCSATPTSGDASTVGEQARVNPALTLAEQDYVDTLLAGLDAYPAYYAHMGPMNRRGPAPVDLSPPEPVRAGRAAPPDRGRRVGGRPARPHRVRRRAPGRSRGFELSDNFVTYLGWLYHYGTPLTLIGETAEQVTQARRELVRIGIDELAGAADRRHQHPRRRAAAALLPCHRLRGTGHGATAGAGAGPRRPPPRRTHRGFVAGSRHIPLHELADRLDEVPEGEVWIYCGSGYRASIAASILDEPGRQVVLINDDYEAATAAGLENDHREGAAPDDAAADAAMQH